MDVVVRYNRSPFFFIFLFIFRWVADGFEVEYVIRVPAQEVYDFALVEGRRGGGGTR